MCCGRPLPSVAVAHALVGRTPWGRCMAHNQLLWLLPQVGIGSLLQCCSKQYTRKLILCVLNATLHTRNCYMRVRKCIHTIRMLSGLTVCAPVVGLERQASTPRTLWQHPRHGTGLAKLHGSSLLEPCPQAHTRMQACCAHPLDDAAGAPVPYVTGNVCCRTRARQHPHAAYRACACVCQFVGGCRASGL